MLRSQSTQIILPRTHKNTQIETGRRADILLAHLEAPPLRFVGRLMTAQSPDSNDPVGLLQSMGSPAQRSERGPVY